MNHQPETPNAFDRTREDALTTSRRGSSAFKLVLLGAMAPLVLYGLAVGGAMLVGEAPEGGAALTVAGASLDCASPRDAWRSACQTEKPGSSEAKAMVTAEDRPVTTGAVERRTSGRSSTGAKSPAIEAAAALPASEPARSEASSAAEPSARMEAADLAARAESSRDNPRPKVTDAETREVTPVSPEKTASAAKPAEEARSRPLDDDIEDAEADPTAARASRLPRTAALPSGATADRRTADSPRSGAKAKAADEAETETRAADRSSLRNRHAEAPAAPSIRKKPRPETDATAEAERSAKLAKARLAREARTVKQRAALAERRKVAERRSAERRLRQARTRTLDDEAPVSSGYAVMSLRTYEFADGRTVTVRVPPRPEVVRELISRHEALTRPRVVYLPRW
jgi:hypothetical protein